MTNQLHPRRAFDRCFACRFGWTRDDRRHFRAQEKRGFIYLTATSENRQQSKPLFVPSPCRPPGSDLPHSPTRRLHPYWEKLGKRRIGENAAEICLILHSA